MPLVNNTSSDTVVFHSGHRRGTLGAKEDKIAKVLNILGPRHPKMPIFFLLSRKCLALLKLKAVISAAVAIWPTEAFKE